MEIDKLNRRQVGVCGERAAAEYLRRRGIRVVDRNVSRKTGELDLIGEGRGEDGRTLHFVEVKTLLTDEFPDAYGTVDQYDPSLNLHEAKIRRVARTAEWYIAETDWQEEWQVDGCLVWIRRRDGRVRVHYLPQIV